VDLDFDVCDIIHLPDIRCARMWGLGDGYFDL
jgi:hypothetical protein